MPRELKTVRNVYFLLDLLLVGISFFLVYYLKRNTLELTLPYFRLLLSFYLLWFFLSLLTHKFSLKNYDSFLNSAFIIIKTNIFILYGLSLMVVIFGMPGFSRLHIFGSVFFLTASEVVLFSLYYFSGGMQQISRISSTKIKKAFYKNFSLPLLIVDFLFLTFSFFLLNYYKRATLLITPEYEKILYLIFALWLLTGLLTRKFDNRPYRNFYYAFAPYAKSAILMAATMAVLVLALRMFFYSRLQIFGTFLFLLLIEAVFQFFYFHLKLKNGNGADIETIDEVQKVIKQELLEIPPNNGLTRDNRPVIPVGDKLENQFLKAHPGVFEFIRDHIDLSQIDIYETFVLDTLTPYNVENVNNNSLELFINLHKVNDFRYLNRYFLEVHKKFFNGGYFVGKARTIETHRKAFFVKYPRYFAEIFYVVNFVFARVIPKLPGLKRIYFALTRGKNRVVSKAELLGRLYFCGFKVLDVQEIEGFLYYIARKVKTPCFDRNPSYGPVIRLRRIGYNGEVMYVYKLRTMYPYSEYLQEYIFEHNQLQSNGKFRDDFRMTEWGRVFRKFWIDELPQVVNYLHGDLNLVGVRALSQHYFSLYPKEMQEFRTRFKPGLVPPYYADMPDSFEEIVDSERQYLQQKQQHPFVTDLRYFGKAFYNIIFKNARSR